MRANWKRAWAMYLACGAVVGFCVGALACPYAAELRQIGGDAQRSHGAIERKHLVPPGSDGLADNLGVRPVFDALSTLDGRAAAQFHIEVDSFMTEDAGIAYHWQLATDRGVFVAEGRAPTAGRLRAKGGYASELWQTPSVPDGYYRMIITAAAGDATSRFSDVAVKDWWLVAEKGSLRDISAEEWYNESQARYAQYAPKEVQQ